MAVSQRHRFLDFRKRLECTPFWRGTLTCTGTAHLPWRCQGKPHDARECRSHHHDPGALPKGWVGCTLCWLVFSAQPNHGSRVIIFDLPTQKPTFYHYLCKVPIVFSIHCIAIPDLRVHCISFLLRSCPVDCN